ncbi:MAG: hypothetical protein AAF456_04625 [Planctomycetota bacterium]
MTPKRKTTALLLAVAVTAVCIPACHRGYYRRQADCEVQRLVREKAVDPRWDSSDGRIDIDPRSRMYDPFSQDHPPIPPDDKTSHQLMRCVDGRAGYPHWHVNGDTGYIENPEWGMYLLLNEQRELEIDTVTAYELALVHSPQLQQQRESLYFSALDVSLARFGFDIQPVAGIDEIAASVSTNPSTSGNDTATTRSRARRLTTTGATIVTGLANNILFNFGPDTSVRSVLDFSIIQPLLRGAGRDRIMESLTQTERTLLADIRQMDRFRRGFYLQVITGRNPGAGPGSNFLGSPAGANFGVGGYYGLLQQQQQIRIQEFNVRQLRNVLNQFQEFQAQQRIDALQVQFFENSLYNAQRGLLQVKNNYQNSLDQFKITLGLPPDLPVRISDPYLTRFEFISDEITERQQQINGLASRAGEDLIFLAKDIPSGLGFQIDELLQGDAGLPEPPPVQDNEFEWPDDLNERIAELAQYVDTALDQIDRVRNQDLTQLDGDFSKLESVRPERVEYLADLRRKLDTSIRLDIEKKILEGISVASADELRGKLDVILTQLAANEENLRSLKESIDAFPQRRQGLGDRDLTNLLRDEILEVLPSELNRLSNLVLEISLLQAEARADSVQLADVSLSEERAYQIARCMRRDLMNARATLVDRWRQIEFVADQLESQVDIEFGGSIANEGDNPFDFRGDLGELNASLRIDAPINRLAERNDYRRTLVRYQQARRSFYQFEDEIKRNLRQTLRTAELNKVLFEIARNSVKLSISRVEAARLRLEQPTAVGATRSSLGATTAQDLTNAINGLQTAQSQFLSVWVTFEVIRRNLDFDLGTMQVDGRGSWIDPGTIDQAIGLRAASAMGIALDCQFCDGVDVMIEEAPEDLDAEFDTYEQFDIRPSLGIDGTVGGTENGSEGRNNYVPSTPTEQRLPLPDMLPGPPSVPELPIQAEPDLAPPVSLDPVGVSSTDSFQRPVMDIFPQQPGIGSPRWYAVSELRSEQEGPQVRLANVVQTEAPSDSDSRVAGTVRPAALTESLENSSADPAQAVQASLETAADGNLNAAPAFPSDSEPAQPLPEYSVDPMPEFQPLQTPVEFDQTDVSGKEELRVPEENPIPTASSPLLRAQVSGPVSTVTFEQPLPAGTVNETANVPEFTLPLANDIPTEDSPDVPVWWQGQSQLENR